MLVVLIAAPLSLLVGYQTGVAGENGSISGIVTVDGVGVSDVWVEAELISENPELGMATTGPDGTYQIAALTPGDYRVRFSLEEHIQEWYDNRYSRDEADPVMVTAGNVTAGIDGQLSMGGSISGRVGDVHAGLSGQHIELYDLDGNKLPGEATTDVEGRYSIGSLIPGSYKVLHMDEGTWFSEKSSFETADPVGVIDNETTSGVDFFVDTTGSISGSVVGEYFGPVPDVDVALVDSAEELVEWTVTDLDGLFSFDNVQSGIYYLFATDPLGDFADAWHPDSPLFDMAFGVSVGLRQDVTGKDIFMQAIAPAGFTDISGTLFEADIVWLAFNGITKGCNPPANDRFCPDDFVTRGQMAAFLVRALGYTDDGGGDLFVDDDNSVFEGDIDRLGTAGVTKGCNPPANDRFCPDDFMTRGQMAAFLVRALGYIDDGGGDLFVDDDNSVFEGDIDRLGTAGVTRGCNPPTNDRFCPNDFVTRGQMAAFLHRALASAFTLESAGIAGAELLETPPADGR